MVWSVVAGYFTSQIPAECCRWSHFRKSMRLETFTCRLDPRSVAHEAARQVQTVQSSTSTDWTDA